MSTKATEAVSPMVEMDAHEFGLHLKEGGWRMGLLVARSVIPGADDPSVTRAERHASDEGKVSATQFGRLAFGHDNGANRVMRYYRGWERAAEAEKVPSPDDLTPGEEPDLDWARLPRWKRYFNPLAFANEGGATGPLNLTIKLGQYGDRLRSTHIRLITFIERDLAGKKVGKPTRELAARYADGLEAEARVLRRLAAGEEIDQEQTKQELDPARYFTH